MSIEAITTSNAGAGTAATQFKDQLGQDAFLQLMITQLRNQDPTSPVDPADFLGQLAQFGTVTGIQQMQDSLATLSDALRSAQVLGGTNMVGRDVLIEADTASLGEGGSILGTVEIPVGTRAASLVISDASGQQVRRIAMPAQAGEIAFEWDGTTETGGFAPAGEYSISVVADVAGKSEQLATQLLARVGSVTIDPSTNSLTLNTDLGPVSLGRVRRVM
jgi:flagellar basal-body rod modification protein FlgD